MCVRAAAAGSFSTVPAKSVGAKSLFSRLISAGCTPYLSAAVPPPVSASLRRIAVAMLAMRETTTQHSKQHNDTHKGFAECRRLKRRA
jgi:hypothetical protein